MLIALLMRNLYMRGIHAKGASATVGVVNSQVAKAPPHAVAIADVPLGSVRDDYAVTRSASGNDVTSSSAVDGLRSGSVEGHGLGRSRIALDDVRTAGRHGRQRREVDGHVRCRCLDAE